MDTVESLRAERDALAAQVEALQSWLRQVAELINLESRAHPAGGELMAILANKNGTLISVVETFKKDHWRENRPNGSLFKVTAAQTHRKVFTGPNAVNDALEWIGTPEALELVQDYKKQQGGTE